MPLTIAPCRNANDLAAAKAIFEAYAAWIEHTLGYSLAKQSFQTELEALPGRYAPPGGDILLARLGEEAVGAIAFYPWQGTVAELKRFYILPHQANHGIGGRLFADALQVAKARGYTHIRLDTLKAMEHARRLYARFGFHEILPYNDNYKDTPDILYYELALADFTC